MPSSTLLRQRIPLAAFALSLLLLAFAQSASAIPVFARQYQTSCTTCHVAFPRLNAFGEEFIASNYRMPGWRDTTMDASDELLALPKSVPLAIRAQAFFQARSGKHVNTQVTPAPSNAVTDSQLADTDFQAPYLIKLLSSAPLSDHITYYFYGIFAEKGGNLETIIEDAWFRHDDVFGSGVGLMLGQFQISDLMFARETRLTFQDLIAYRMAGITYDRGVILDRGLGPIDIAIGVVNGNGIEQNFKINSPGFQRPDRMFDNDSRKTGFGRIGVELGDLANVGVFGLWGKQKSADASRDTVKRIGGIDASGNYNDEVLWYAQFLWNAWDDFINPGQNYRWYGGFAGIDYILNDHWAFSTLYNIADARDFEGTGTVFEGIDVNALTFTASYYFMRNVKLVAEVNVDLLAKESLSATPFEGQHLTKEHYALIGFDAAF
ncbi:MAG: hypothetical protein R8K46_02820 [Mariprofundaceae bacterium]